MKFAMCLMVFLFSALAVADNSESARAQDGSVPLELPNFSEVQNTKPDSKGAVAVSMTCKTTDHQTLKSGDPGYEACMSSAQSELARDPKHRNQATPTRSPELNFSFGE